MTAPDAQPPAALDDVNPHWSPTTGLLWWEDGTYVTVEGGEIVEDGFALPADAVRLVADEMAADILDANERMGEALVAIGMALGMPAPRTGATWGAPEILARVAASAALAGTTTPTDEEAEFVEEALRCADTGNAGHWPTAAGYLADEMRDGARHLREQAADPNNDHYAVSLRENAAEWERLADRTEETSR